MATKTLTNHPTPLSSGSLLLVIAILASCVTTTDQTPPAITTAKPVAGATSTTPITAGEPAARFPAPGVEPKIIAAPIEQAPVEDPAKELVRLGRYLDAALLLSELAYSLPSPNRQDYLLRVTSLLLQGNYIQQADQILRSINIQGLPANYIFRKAILSAELSLAEQKPEQALQYLNSLKNNISSVTPDEQKQYYRARIEVNTNIGNYAGAAFSRAALHFLLIDSEEIQENQETLLRDLQNISAQDLGSLISQTNDPTWKGWLELAAIATRIQNEQQAQAEVGQWQQQFTNHPVTSNIIETIILQRPEALGRPTQIALILPMSGKFRKAATAIRDGFLAAYYAEGNQAFRPKLRLYDEGQNPEQIQSIAQRAIDDGADFIVGPLSKKSVSVLAQGSLQDSGVLTLNYSDSSAIDTIPSNFFQISLSPEQEAIHVAEHAWLDGHTNAASIYPATAWGKRVYTAFKSRWEELGGVVVEHQTYDTRKSDYAVPIKQLLNLDESDSRYSDIRKVVRKKIHFEPRRRKDVDFIFMAAFARQGRLLRPQLKFHRATEIPVYATSHVYSGRFKPEMDRDMNGVKFSDMPWTLKSQSKNAVLKKQIARLWPNRSNRYMRLYALGVDAYQILPELNRMRRNRFATYQGETGVLYMGIANRLQRKLLWAQFEKGRPKILAEF